MRRKAGTDKPTADRVVKDIRRKTRKHHSADEKIRIVLEGLRGEASALKEAVADLTLENRLLKKACSGMGNETLSAIGSRTMVE